MKLSTNTEAPYMRKIDYVFFNEAQIREAVIETKEVESYTDYTVDEGKKTEKVETYTGATYTILMISDYFRVKLKDFMSMNEAYLFFREIKGAYDDDENFVVEN